MAREEKQANIYAIPKNSFDTGYVFGGQFKTRNFVEGVVVNLTVSWNLPVWMGKTRIGL